LRLVLRIVVSGALLGVLIWRIPDFRASELVPSWTAATAWWLAAAAVTLLVAFGLQTLRWNQVLRALGYRVRFRRLFTEFLAGQFISNVLPAAVGGDIVRVSRLGRELDDAAAAFASVALERLTGWLVLPVISGAVIAATPGFHHLPHHATTIALVVDAVSLVGLVAILGVAANRRWSEAARTATGWRRWLGTVHLGSTAILSKPSSIWGTLLAGMAFQVTQCLSIWMTAKALGVDRVSVGVALAFFPPTAILQNMPVGFGGLGVREVGFVLFFGAVGVAKTRAIAVGLVGYVIMVVTSAFGAPAFALGGWKRELDEVDEAIEELEHEPAEPPTDTAAAP
jgi:uncharacterized membrane protein YbhN (UPF0104 family)